MDQMKANKYKGQNPLGLGMSEKLDGIYAKWTGYEFLSKEGNKFEVPEWYTCQLSKEILEGELFMGRGMLQKTVGPVRRAIPIDTEWRLIKYHVFDAPEVSGDKDTRLAFCSKILKESTVAEIIKTEICKSRKHLDIFFSKLISAGAEGIMLHKVGIEYEPGKTDNLLKYKPLDSDEAKIIGYQAGKGKHKGRLGALICEWKGKIVKLGTGFSDELREFPPHIGSIVTFTFQGLTDGGIPRNSSFIIERSYE